MDREEPSEVETLAPKPLTLGQKAIRILAIGIYLLLGASIISIFAPDLTNQYGNSSPILVILSVAFCFFAAYLIARSMRAKR
jgi:ABC-type transport system involved in cytochrome c biogenesis permease subunit